MTNAAIEKVTSRFIEAIKTSGELPWQKPWRSIAFRNAVSNRQYNGINVLVLAMFGNDTDFVTFNQAKDNGGMVKKGSKGMPICYFQFLDKKDKVTGAPVMKNGKVDKWPMLRYSTVFNLSDIDGCEVLKAKALKRKKAIDFTPIEACEKLVSFITAPVAHKGNVACYSPAVHAITMPEKETFRSVEAYYCTLFHEIGHSLSKETGEDISNNFGNDPYAREELVAELFANFCLSFVGIDSSKLFDNSLAYLQNWQKKLTDDPSVLISAASKASKRFNLLLERAGLAGKEETETEETEVAA